MKDESPLEDIIGFYAIQRGTDADGKPFRIVHGYLVAPERYTYSTLVQLSQEGKEELEARLSEEQADCAQFHHIEPEDLPDVYAINIESMPLTPELKSQGITTYDERFIKYYDPNARCVGEYESTFAAMSDLEGNVDEFIGESGGDMGLTVVLCGWHESRGMQYEAIYTPFEDEEDDEDEEGPDFSSDDDDEEEVYGSDKQEAIKKMNKPSAKDLQPAIIAEHIKKTYLVPLAEAVRAREPGDYHALRHDLEHFVEDMPYAAHAQQATFAINEFRTAQEQELLRIIGHYTSIIDAIATEAYERVGNIRKQLHDDTRAIWKSRQKPLTDDS